MASPQVEDGYTKIANEILDALISHRLSGQEYQIVYFIIRKTYGFNKTCDFISMGQIAKATGIKRPKVSMILSNLYTKNILGVTEKGNSVPQNGNSQPNCLYFQKDYEQWRVLPKKVTVPQNGNRSVPQNGTGGVPQNGTHKRKSFTKERKKEKMSIPEWISRQSLDAFIEMRNKIKKPLTDRAIDLLIKKLEGFKNRGYDANEIMDTSTFNSWQGVFQPKEPPKKQKSIEDIEHDSRIAAAVEESKAVEAKWD